MNLFLECTMGINNIITRTKLEFTWDEVTVRCIKVVLRGRKWMQFAISHFVLYLEFKFRYLKNMKLFSISVKELFEPTVLRRQDDGLLFLKAFS